MTDPKKMSDAALIERRANVNKRLHRLHMMRLSERHAREAWELFGVMNELEDEAERRNLGRLHEPKPTIETIYEMARANGWRG
jgi:hypothetical protein